MPLVDWDELQHQAIDACCDTSKRIVAVTGKAGTGKTVILEEVSRRLEQAGYTVQSSAPTGKAAKRIREATGLQAMTNHRMLGYGMPRESKWMTTRQATRRSCRCQHWTTLRHDAIHCNTTPSCVMSMRWSTRRSHRNLIDALKAGARICMFGDVNQLKPIEEDRRLDQQP